MNELLLILVYTVVSGRGVVCRLVAVCVCRLFMARVSALGCLAAVRLLVIAVGNLDPHYRLSGHLRPVVYDVKLTLSSTSPVILGQVGGFEGLLLDSR